MCVCVCVCVSVCIYFLIRTVFGLLTSVKGYFTIVYISRVNSVWMPQDWLHE